MNGNAKWLVWLFRLVITTAVAGIIADRVRVGAQINANASDIRALQTEVDIYHRRIP